VNGINLGRMYDAHEERRHSGRHFLSRRAPMNDGGDGADNSEHDKNDYHQCPCERETFCPLGRE
jgi:hypothetical protein